MNESLPDRVLGVHATASTLWLAVADDGGPVDIGEDYKIELPTALESGEALTQARDDVARLLRRYSVQRVWLLSAETSREFKQAYTALVPRITMETVVAFAAAAEGREFRRVARGTVRAILQLPKDKKLSLYAGQVVEKQGPNWRPDKRDLAAVTAVAALRDSETSHG